MFKTYASFFIGTYSGHNGTEDTNRLLSIHGLILGLKGDKSRGLYPPIPGGGRGSSSTGSFSLVNISCSSLGILLYEKCINSSLCIAAVALRGWAWGPEASWQHAHRRTFDIPPRSKPARDASRGTRGGIESGTASPFSKGFCRDGPDKEGGGAAGTDQAGHCCS